jgi:hypothetical protein
MGGWMVLVVRFWVISMDEKVKDFSAMMRAVVVGCDGLRLACCYGRALLLGIPRRRLRKTTIEKRWW